MKPNLRLPLRFDPAALRRDLALVGASEWTPHYNQQDYGGDWRGVALRSVSGQSSQLIAQGESFADTTLLGRCPYFQEVLGAFHCPLKSVRLLSLAPGSFIREHCDAAVEFEEREVRLHIPIRTDARVEFYSSGKRLRLEEGSCYYINVSQPHRVHNRWTEERVHLVIDAQVNDWLCGLFGSGQPVEGAPSDFGRFRAAVLNNPALQARLHAASDDGSFVSETLNAARDLGFEIEEGELEHLAVASSDRQPGPEWVPVRLSAGNSRHLAEWVYLGAKRYVEPFFEDTMRAALRNPFARAFRHEAPLEQYGGTPPSGLIFHVSRCGSTLAAQMLAALPETSVISEAPAIDEAIQLGDPALLRAVVGALRRGDGPCIVKLDAWHIHSLPLIRAAFPQTPWVFLYRHPVEVLVYHLLSPGKLALPGAMNPALLGLQTEDVTAVPRDEWAARAVAGFFEAALKYRGEPRGLFLDFRQLPAAMWDVAA